MENKETIQERKPSIAQMLAKLEGIKFEPKELIGEWLLLTYDLPANEEGNKARYDFIKKAFKIGAVMHTRSVYLMPWTDQAEIAALEVTKKGQAFLWHSQAKDEQARELTNFYDGQIGERLDEVANRIERIKKHKENDELKFANRMLRKTGELLNDVSNTLAARGDLKTLQRMLDLYKKLIEVGNGSLE